MLPYVPVLLAAHFGLAGSVSTSHPPTCCKEENYRTYEFEVEMGYRVSPGPLTAVAQGTANSIVVDFWQTFASGTCVPDPLIDGTFFGPSDTDAVNLLVEPLSLSSSVGGVGHIYEAFGSATVNWQATEGSSKAKAKSGMGTEDYYEKPTGGCIYKGYAVLNGWGYGIPTATGAWTFASRPTFSTYAKVTAQSAFVVSEPCCEDDSSPPVEITYVQFASMTMTDSGGAQTVQGVYAGFEDGSVVRLGFFAAPPAPAPDPFAPTYSGTNYTVTSGEVALSHSPGVSATSISLESHQDVFSNFDGDIDASMTTCGADRTLMCSLIGVSLNNPLYTARADFDLNGVINATDLLTFNTVKCNADLNCNGMIDVNDYIAFQAAHGVQDPEADMNADGLWNITDYTLFQNAAAVGCP